MSDEFNQKVHGRRFYEDRRVSRIKALPRCVWVVLNGLGGAYGWYHADWLCELRGSLDSALGGVGMRRRSRTDQAPLRRGAEVGFWRVLSVVPGHRLELLAEMKLPGIATLTFEVKNVGDGTSELDQIARFWPSSFLGDIYWYSFIPAHHYIFKGMIQKIGNIASGLDCELCPDPCLHPN